MGFCLKAEMMLSRYQQPHIAVIWDLILLLMYSLKQTHCAQGCLPGFIPWCYLPVSFPVFLEMCPPPSSQHRAGLTQGTVLHWAYVGAIPLNEPKAQQGEGKTCYGKENRIQSS